MLWSVARFHYKSFCPNFKIILLKWLKQLENKIEIMGWKTNCCNESKSQKQENGLFRLEPQQKPREKDALYWKVFRQMGIQKQFKINILFTSSNNQFSEFRISNIYNINFVYLHVQKQVETLYNLYIEITQPFLVLSKS